MNIQEAMAPSSPYSLLTVLEQSKVTAHNIAAPSSKYQDKAGEKPDCESVKTAAGSEHRKSDTHRESRPESNPH